MTLDERSGLREPQHEPKLTAAAEERLDQNVAVIRQQILREIWRRYASDSDHKARAADVEDAIRRVMSVDSSTDRSTLKLAGVVLVLSGLAIGLAVFLTSSSSTPFAPLPAVIALLIGATLGTATALFSHETKFRKRTSYYTTREFMHAFSDLESAIRWKARELLGDASENVSLGRAISAVELLQLWTTEDSHSFRSLLMIRNSVVHEDRRNLPASRMAQSFAEIARLKSLLDANGGSKYMKRLSSSTKRKAGLAYEERVANALRLASMQIESAPPDTGYDLLASRAESLVRIVIKYRPVGPLTVNDISNIVGVSTNPTVIVTNAPISPYVDQLFELEPDSLVRVISWNPGDSIEVLADAIILYSSS